MCVNNLPKVVNWKWNGRDSNPRPFDFESQIQTLWALRNLNINIRIMLKKLEMIGDGICK